MRIKSKKVKPRIPVAPPSKRHKSAKDYDRKALRHACLMVEDDFGNIVCLWCGNRNE